MVHTLPCVLLAATPAVARAQGPGGAPAAAAPAADNQVLQGEAKIHQGVADKAARAKDWATAVKEYDASLAAVRTQAALQGLANAHYQLKHVGEAYDAYDDLIKTYDATLRGGDKATALRRLKELSASVGAISVRVNEAGATVTIDGNAVGKTPVAALLHVKAGTHKLAVTKDGFLPVERTSEVPAGGKTIEEVTLQAEARTGHLVIKEKTAQPLRALVDGVDVGATPYEGDLDPGPHEVAGRSATLIAPPQTVEIVKGKRFDVELVATTVHAHLEIRTSDNKGVIYLDGKPVGEGSYAADVPVGLHVLEVKREGYLPYKKEVELADKQAIAEAVTLKQEGGAGGVVKKESRTLDGLYGGIAAGAFMAPDGQHNSLETNCDGLGATSCSKANPLGGSLTGYIGWAFNPVGLELFFGGAADVATPSATFDGKTGSSINPLIASPPRKEDFVIARGGGMGAVRARFSWDVSIFRFTAAAGVGAAVKYIRLGRTTNSTDGNNMKNIYVGGDYVYVSPAAGGEVAVGVGLGEATHLMLGLQLWGESAGDNARTKGDSGQYLGSLTAAVPPQPLATPAYDMAKGAQFFVGPFLGLQFGP